MWPTDTATVRFTIVATRAVPEPIVSHVRGLDAAGDIVVSDPELASCTAGEYLYPLTPCCLSPARYSDDSPTHAACRACGWPVDAKFTGRATVAVPVDTRDALVRDLFAAVRAFVAEGKRDEPDGQREWLDLVDAIDAIDKLEA